jgi:DNA-binding transcriptional ArsR family regulator
MTTNDTTCMQNACQGYKDVPFPDTAAQLADLFSLMGDTTRLRNILARVAKPIKVGEIVKLLEVSFPLDSHHLRFLGVAQVLRSERRGKQIFYSAMDDHIQCVIDDMLAHIRETFDAEEEY